MGLAEKRTAESIKTEKLPAFEAKLKDKAGYDIKVDINWDTFTAYDQYPLSRLDIVFDDLESFVKKICSDDMGKEALQDKMSTIQLTNSDNNDDVKMELKDNTLSLTVQLVQGSFSSQTDSQIANYVEALL
ncbi:hypothetical protein [Flavobacterium sp. 5]|uniref:hypothetical protein n=1 Tax=Flavobacterium sp. 5 TaxID=2035199 RepID=UPI000C2CBB9E|nr:hypothetical protein [Flavobacterium sp. 5]PKB17158.1 hypothetical protein CLU82_2339 [Flavobacterium sp. 5]